ncbi:MAG: hypothetical protein E7271_08000 [Lachnospiraceae bacterium]|jgi:hypothetical protein|nr:hypothetical protein [Lachnospiraceae bacterium]
MRITESAVAMSGKSSYSHYQESTSVVVQMSASRWKELGEQAAVMSISDEGKRRGSINGFGSRDAVMREKNHNREKVKQLLEENATMTDEVQSDVRADSKDEQIIRILRKLTEILRQMRNGGRLRNYSDIRKEMQAEEMQEFDQKFEDTMKRLGRQMPVGSQTVLNLTGGRANGVAGSAAERRANRENAGNLWVRYEAKSSFVMEQESTHFATTGVAKTADGREISFNLDLEMSRAFAGTIQSEKLENYIMTDPLVINLDDSPAGLSDQKFYFDIDSDGKKDKISSLRQGSAFLAYDKNGDGVVNDGSELFGTKSGNGFADLAAYDTDGNGWIDEEDDIYSKLTLWTKDENGNDKMLSLKEADVGAIYLRSASTNYHLNDASNTTNGMIRQTGIFLRESGGVGTVQHVDLAV